MEVNYKNKYHALRLKFMNAVDMAFRLGYEQGMKDAAMDQMQQAQEQAAQAEANAQANGENGEGGEGENGEEGQNPNQEGQEGEGGEQPGQEEGQPGEEGGEGNPVAGAQPGMPGQAAPGAAPAGIPQGMQQADQGGELDQHIATLEGMLGKPSEERSSEDTEKIEKSLTALKSFRQKVKFDTEMKKSDMAVKAIAKAMNPKKKMANAANSLRMNQVASHNLGQNSKKALSLQEKIVKDVMKSWGDQETKAKEGVLNILNVEGLTKKE